MQHGGSIVKTGMDVLPLVQRLLNRGYVTALERGYQYGRNASFWKGKRRITSGFR